MSDFPSLPPNPELSQLNFLIGTWNVEMRHSAIPQALTWQDSFSWLDNGFIVWHWQGKKEVPAATLIIGRNEENLDNKFTILYYDARGISRCMDMIFENNIWKFWREGKDFFQRTEYTINEEKTAMTGHGEMSKD
jgi:hypothetical protein